MATPAPPTPDAVSACRIVPLGREHLVGFHAALDRVAREGRYLAMLQAPSLSRTRRFVLDSLKDGAIHVVAVVDGEVVGWCDLRPRTNPTQRHSAVLGMGVVAEHRSRGLGKALLASTLERADARGLRRAELIVREDNVPAVTLYRRFGFVVEGRCRAYLRLDGADHDALLMARLIEDAPD
jgi:ribosomal protein S18 acetylase RimI-like enzyme